MKSCPLCRCIPGLVALLLSACATSQGPSNAVNDRSEAQTAERIGPAPESKSFAGAEGVLSSTGDDPDVGPPEGGNRLIRLRPGQIVEVFRGRNAPGDGRPELAFYLPVEARSVVQLVVGSKGCTKTYFLRAIRTGDTVGGVVERRWLDDDGYNPRDPAAATRIRKAVRAAPHHISVY